MDRKQKILELAKQMGLIRPRDVEAAGIHREYLLRLYRNGDLARVGRGLYALPGTQTSESISLAEVAKRIPNAVVCLISALQFHNLTTQIAPRVWKAIENKTWKDSVTTASKPMRASRKSLSKSLADVPDSSNRNSQRWSKA